MAGLFFQMWGESRRVHLGLWTERETAALSTTGSIVTDIVGSPVTLNGSKLFFFPLGKSVRGVFRLKAYILVVTSEYEFFHYIGVASCVQWYPENHFP